MGEGDTYPLFYDHFTLVSFSFFPDHSSVFFRRFLRLFLALAFVSVVAVFCINVWILQSTEYSIYTDLQSVPEKQAVLVLGSRVYSTGQVSTILADRLDASVDLYQAKKVQKILVSGDHGTDGYDEANAMRRYLVKKGIPAEDIFMDHAGFDTYDSVYRAKHVFQAQSLIIVSQSFHVPRALMIAQGLSLDAVALTADRHEYPRAGEIRSHLRETLARMKAFFDVLFASKPTFLGEPMPLTGDGRVTEDGK